MALSPISVGDTGAQVRAKINAGFTATDAATTGLAAELVARAAADTAEATARSTEVNLASVLDLARPGERPEFWTSSTAGAPSALASLTGSVTRQDGAAISITGAGTRAPRWILRLEPGRNYRIRYVVRRITNSPDPANDAVDLKVQWMNATKAAISTTTLDSITDLTTGSGRIERLLVISTATGPETDAVAPNGTIYARPYVETFGALCVTDVEVIEAVDVTEWGVYNGGDLTELTSDVEALKSIHAGDRLDLIESALDGTKIQRFATYADAVGATLLDTAELAETLGYSETGDGGGAQYIISDTEPSHDGKIEFANGKWGEIVNSVIKPRMLGAVADGATDDTSIIDSVLAIGKPIDGDGLIYAVSGDVLLPEVTDLRRSRFKQLNPDSSSRRTLYWNHVSGKVVMEDVEVDRNGDGTGGGLNSAAGIWIEGGSRHRLTRLRVTGDDKGSGIVLRGVSESTLIDPVVENIAFDEPTADDDRIQGIWFDNTTDCIIERPQIEDLSGNVTGAAANIFTRGIACGGNARLTIIDPKIRNVDQGIDFTGSLGNLDCIVMGGQLYQCLSTAVKFANSAVRCKAIGVTSIRCGYWSFITAGPAEDGLPYYTQDCMFIGCVAVDTGAISSGYPGSPSTRTAFIVSRGEYQHSYPKGIKFVNCLAIDTQSVKTMQFGFINQRQYSIYDQSTGKLNETIGCRSIGHTVRGFDGMDDYSLSLKLEANQSISSGSFQSITWTSAEYDNAYTLNQSDKTEIIALADGYYSYSAVVGFDNNTSGNRIVRVYVNGVITPGNTQTSAPVNGSVTTVSVTGFGYLRKGQVIEVQAYQSSGGALNALAEYTSLKVSLVQSTHFSS